MRTFDVETKLDAMAKARDLLEVLQMWGMKRKHAKDITTHMLTLLNDSTYTWRDMTKANAAEFDKLFRTGTVEAVSITDKETKQ